MNVLDIYPNYCWSLQGFDAETIERLRTAVAITDPQELESALQAIAGGEAFKFPGDTTKLDFAPRFFDEVNLRYEPDAQKRVQLRQCMRRWSRTGTVEPEVSSPDEKSILARYFERFFPKKTAWA